MKRLKAILGLSALFSLLALTPFSVQSQNDAAGELLYEYVAPDSFTIILNLTRDCGQSGQPLVPTVLMRTCDPTFQVIDMTQVGGSTEISDVCDLDSAGCNTEPFPGRLLYQFQGGINVNDLPSTGIALSQGCNYHEIFYYINSSRNSTENFTGPGNSMRVDTRIYFANDTTNSSPVFGNSNYTPFSCINAGFSFDPQATDIDGDSLVFSLDTARSGTIVGSNISYTTGTPSEPFAGLSISSTTGVVSGTTPATAGNYTIVVAIDEYDPTTGLQVGRVIRDFQLVVVNCANTAPVADTISNTSGAILSPPFTDTLTAGVLAQFSLPFTDAEGDGIAFTNNIAAMLNGANVTVNANDIAVSWTPTSGDIGTYTITVDAEDDACEINASASQEYIIEVQGTQPLVINSVTVVDESCTGDDDGELTINTSGGIGPFGYQIQFIDGGVNTIVQDSNHFVGLGGNFYQITVIDSGNFNATESTTATIQDGAVLQITSFSGVGATCPGSCTGDATAQVFTNGAPTFTWDNGEANAAATALCEGFNVVTATLNGCVRQDSVDISANPAIVIATDSVVTVSCNGLSDGGVFISVTGGTAGYTYSWDGGSTNQDLSGQSAGSYTVTVTDAIGCTATATETVTEPNTLTATVTPTDPSCNGETDGEAMANPSDGTAPYTYLWSDGQVTQTATNLVAGNFTVTVTDANGCTVAASTTLTDPSAVTASIFIDSTVSCNGFSDGGLTASGGGGDGGPYTFLWSTGATSASITGLAAASYTVTVTDGNGCTATAIETMTQPLTLDVSVILDQNVTCNGGDDGGATATGLDGTGPYTYLWDNGEANASAVNLDAGTHTVTVTDANGCTTADQIVITEPVSGVSAVVTVDSNASCFGFTDGGLTVAPSGGTAPYTFLWSNNDTTASITGVGAGTYTVTVTDVNGCTATDAGTVTEPIVLAATATGVDPSCNGGADGTATANATGGTVGLDYSYLWNDGQITQIATGLNAGTYTVTVTDDNGCTTSASTTLSDPAAPVVTFNPITNVSCNGFTDGSVTASIPNGVGYAWNTGQVGATISSLAAGTYTVTATDNSGCTAVDDVTITQPTTLGAAISNITDVSCFGDSDGTATAVGSGGTGPYGFEWDVAAGSQITATASNLATGLYNVTVTDDNGCTATVNAFVPEPASAVAITIDSVTNAVCAGNANGAIFTTTIGGTPNYTYNWLPSGSGEDPTGLIAGTYFVTVTDDNGCEDTETVIVSEPATLLANASITAEVSCNGDSDGEVTVASSGGTAPYTQLWNNGSTGTSISGLIGGTYSVTVTDVNACAFDTSITVVNPPSIFGEIDATTDPTCSNDDGQAIIIGFGGQQVSGNTSTYHVVQNTTDFAPYGEDVDGSDRFTLGDDAVSGLQDIGFSFDFFGNTQTTFRIAANGNIQFPNSASGSFTNTAIPNAGGPNNWIGIWDDLNPSVTASEIIETYMGGVAPNRIRVINYIAVPHFSNNAALFTFQIVLHENSNIIEVHTTSAPSVTGDNVAGKTFGIENSTGTAGFSVDGRNMLASASSVSNDYTAYIPMNQDFDYLWPDGGTDSARTDLASGDYCVTLTDPSNGTCFDTVCFTLAAPDTFQLTLDTTSITCAGGPGTITANTSGTPGPFTFLWNTTATTQSISVAVAGTYTVTVTDQTTGCEIIADTVMTGPTIVTLSTDSVDESCSGAGDGIAICEVLTGVAPYTYTWSTGALNGPTANLLDSIVGLSPGTYTVTVTASNGCADTTTVTVNAPASSMSFSNPTVMDPTCPGELDGSITFFMSGGTPGYSFSWSSGLPATNLQFNIAAGTYTVTVTDNAGCTKDSTFVLNDPIFSLDSLVVDGNCFGQQASISAIVTGGTAPFTFLWNTGATTQSITGISTGTYSVTVTETGGCVDSMVNIPVTDPDTLQLISTIISQPSCNGSNDGSITVSATGGSGTYSFLWSDLTTTNDTISGIGAGTYTVTVSDAGGSGCSNTATEILVSPSSYAVNLVNITDVSCAGGSDGAITISLSGTPTNPVTYLWSNNDTAMNPTGLIAGTYTVTATDNNGCTAASSGFVVDDGVSVGVSVTTTDNFICFGPCTGGATAVWGGGAAPYNFAWSTGTNGSTVGLTTSLSALCAGLYDITVTDANGCTGTNGGAVSDVIGASPVTASAIDASCFGSCDGLLAADTSFCIGGCTVYWYELGNNTPIDSVDTLTGVCPGDYVAELVNGFGCSRFDTTIVGEPTEIVTTVVAQDASCSGNADGSASASAIGGSPGYTFAWSTGQSGTSINNLAAGTYSVITTDITGCTDTVFFNIDAPSSIATSTTIISGLQCFGDSNGEASVSVTGGTMPYTYLWSSGETTAIADSLQGGMQFVTVTDDSGCFVIDTAIIPEPTQVIALITETQAITCFGGGNDGELSATTSTGGTGVLSFLWNTGSTSSSISNLTAAQYCVTVTDLNGCEADTCFDLVDPTGITADTTNVQDALCLGEASGQATALGIGGSGTYTFLWSDNSANATATNLAAGTYSVIVTDAATACADTLSGIVIGEPSSAVAGTITSVIDNVCFNGTEGEATASGSGGTGPYTFLWSNGDTGPTADSLPAGTVTVTVTDNNGCNISVDTTIAEPGSGLDASAFVFAGPLCIGDSGVAIASATGGSGNYIFDWGNGITGDTVDLPAGSYCVTVSDGGTCTDSACVTIVDPQPITAAATLNAPQCAGDTNGSISIVISGGSAPYTVLWSTGATTTTIINLSAGTYTVTITDANACTGSLPFTLNDPAALSASFSLISPSGCLICDGEAQVDPSNGTAPYSFDWFVSNESTQFATQLCSGLNPVEVTDLNGCLDTFNVTIPSDSADTVLAFGNDPSCNNDCNGLVFATYNCSIAPCTVQWVDEFGAPLGTTDTLDSVCAGTYIVNLTNAGGCVSSDTIVLDPANAVVATIAGSTNVTCQGGDDGEATAQGVNGTAPYTYLWSDNQSGPTATNLIAGTYSVTVTDATGCTDSTSVIITEPSSTVSVVASTIDNVSCNGGFDGSVTAQGFNGSGIYTFTWNGATVVDTLQNVPAGVYIVVVDDGTGCTATDTTIVTEPTQVIAVIDSTDSPGCPGDSTGVAYASAFGGTVAGSYSFLWPSGNTGASEGGLPAGTYCVTVTDDNGCSDVQCANITDPAGMSNNFTNVNDATCGVCDGTAIANTSGGNGTTYTYLWSNNEMTAGAVALCAGINTVTITDTSGCTLVDNVLINNVGADTVIAGGLDAACGQCDGTVFATYNCTTAPCTVQWSTFPGGVNIGTTDTIQNLCPGSYLVELTNGLGCISVDTVTISAPAVILPNETLVDAGCFGSCDGSITLVPTGGSGVFTYNWSNGAGNTATNANLCAGTYTVTISDNGGCDSVAVFTIDEPLEILSNPTVVEVSCFGVCDGSISLAPSNGIGLYSYNWSPVPSNGNGTSQATSLCAGLHIVTVTDGNNCSIIDSFTITEPTQIVLDSVDLVDATCGQSDGSIDPSFSGGTMPYSFLWSTGSVLSSVNGLPAGLYTVTVTDNAGCTAEFNFPVSETNGPGISLSTTNATQSGECDGTATATVVTGGGTITYIWSNGDTTQTADSLCAGSYSVTVIDSTGCSTIDTFSITEPDSIAIVFAVTEISCSGGGCDGEITASVVGGIPPFAFIWSTGDTGATVDSLCAGTYTLTVLDSFGATVIDSVTLDDPDPINVLPLVTNVTCPGTCDGIIDLTISGGDAPYTIQWSTGDTTAMIDSLCAGTYSVTVLDTSGCFDTLSILVTEPAPLAITVDSILNPNCLLSDGYIDVTASGGTPFTGANPYAYRWMDALFDTLTPAQNDTAASNLFAGIYNVEITDSNGCLDTFNVILNNLNAPVIALDSIRDVSCFGECDGAVFTSVTGGTNPLTILWSSGGTFENDSNLCAGPDTIAVSDANFCLSFDIYQVNEPAELIVTGTQQTNVTCAENCDGTASLDVEGGFGQYLYNWSNGAIDTNGIGNLCSGMYTVTVTDENGCSVIEVFNISGPDTLEITLDSLDNATCNTTSDGNIYISVAGGSPPFTYDWTTSTGSLTSQDLTNILSGTYGLVLTDANGCTASASYNVDALFGITVSASGDSNVCPGATGIVVTAIDSGAASLRWINGNGIVVGSGNSAIVDVYTDTNLFIIEATNNICVVRDTIVIFETSGPGIYAGEDRTIEPGDVTTLGGNPTAATGVSVTWTPVSDLSDDNDLNPDAEPLQTRWYYVSGTDSIGCFGIDSVLVTVEELVDPKDGFSPNGDGVNDNFFIDRIDEFPNAEVIILNRWGNQIFQSEPGYTNPWNGKFNGNTLPTGTYYYIIDLKDDRASGVITGPVTILK